MLMDDEDEGATMDPERARRITDALGALRESVMVETPGPRARAATNLVTQATRQCLLAMAEALAPVDEWEALDEVRCEIAGKAWRALSKLGPMLIETLPEEYR